MLEYATAYGDPDAPTVVLLHPAGATRHAWRPHAEALRDDYRVVAVDLPAHGIHPEAEFSFERAVADVGAVLEDEGPAVLVGHSQGGYVAMRAAAALEGRVDGLLLAGADYDWREPKLLAVSAVYYPLTYVFEAITYSDRLNEWIVERFDSGRDGQEPPPDENTYESLHGLASAIRASLGQESRKYVERYDGPVLVAHGTDEAFRSHAETLAARTDARLEWYDGGHQAPMEDADAFAALVRDFLEDVYSSSGGR